MAIKIVGKCADLTSGTVNIVEPLELLAQLTKISQKPLLATEVEIKLIAPKEVEWVDASGKNPSIITQDIGNATADTDFTFAFRFSESIKDSVRQHQW
jgi:hypothetical protein